MKIFNILLIAIFLVSVVLADRAGQAAVVGLEGSLDALVEHSFEKFSKYENYEQDNLLFSFQIPENAKTADITLTFKDTACRFYATNSLRVAPCGSSGGLLCDTYLDYEYTSATPTVVISVDLDLENYERESNTVLLDLYRYDQTSDFDKKCTFTIKGAYTACAAGEFVDDFTFSSATCVAYTNITINSNVTFASGTSYYYIEDVPEFTAYVNITTTESANFYWSYSESGSDYAAGQYVRDYEYGQMVLPSTRGIWLRVTPFSSGGSFELSNMTCPMNMAGSKCQSATMSFPIIDTDDATATIPAGAYHVFVIDTLEGDVAYDHLLNFSLSAAGSVTLRYGSPSEYINSFGSGYETYDPSNYATVLASAVTSIDADADSMPHAGTYYLSVGGCSTACTLTYTTRREESASATLIISAILAVILALANLF